ncbi:hypothetical protein N7450_008904 [Penicillium hetheringtonii]|uniref:BHLH domain-containing protein n=1 Tax=Penicillium hetheringtonii TaxID=911720 RepID=A0AAD6DE24_9EURO|nr:hypothetical protein N7450_008904 [Penicillium hetheringtonii]
MSRSRFPPTPAMSGGFSVKDKPIEGTDVFALPPAAISPAKEDSDSRRSSQSDPTYEPASPTSPELPPRGRHQTHHTSRSGAGTKRPLEDFDLPPPPTRTRKIIQMKPKSPTTSKSPAKSKENGKMTSQSADSTAQTATASKKKPSATSAAGRKIARKTAHSLIERRRRSKMNEEFGTLKDMIPACRGQEMHKLAILQASIDYVNYLEQIIQDLKTDGGHHSAIPPSPPSPDFTAEGIQEISNQLPQNAQSSVYSYVSPSFSPRTRLPSVHTLPEAPSILPSPALGPSYHSLDKVQDLQGIDHEASAALLMLTRDRRGTADSITEHFSTGTTLSLRQRDKTPYRILREEKG